MSSSGGAWTSDGRLVTTGHHARELYLLKLPSAGGVLDLEAIASAESEGQGIAIDPGTGLLWSIQRKTAEVLVSKIP